MIANESFLAIFKPVASGDSKLEEIHLSGNLIGGSGNDLNTSLMCSSRHLKVLDLSMNKLIDQNGK